MSIENNNNNNNTPSLSTVSHSDDESQPEMRVTRNLGVPNVSYCEDSDEGEVRSPRFVLDRDGDGVKEENRMVEDNGEHVFTDQTVVTLDTVLFMRFGASLAYGHEKIGKSYVVMQALFLLLVGSVKNAVVAILDTEGRKSEIKKRWAELCLRHTRPDLKTSLLVFGSEGWGQEENPADELEVVASEMVQCVQEAVDQAKGSNRTLVGFVLDTLHFPVKTNMVGRAMINTFQEIDNIAKANKFPALLVCHLNVEERPVRPAGPVSPSRISGSQTLSKLARLNTAIHRPCALHMPDKLVVTNTGRNGAKRVTMYVQLSNDRYGNCQVEDIPAIYTSLNAKDVINHFFRESETIWVNLADMEAFAANNGFPEVTAELIAKAIRNAPFRGLHSAETYFWRPHIRLPVSVTITGTPQSASLKRKWTA